MKRIVIVGAGFGGVYAFKYLAKFLGKNSDVEITLINERNYFLFTPLLHEVATGGISPENIVEPIRKVLKCRPESFHHGRVEEISFEKRTVRTHQGTIHYDYLVLAPGATTNFYGTPGAEKYSYTLKSLEDAIRLKDRMIECVERASQTRDVAKRDALLRFVVVGGGATGVELASEMEEFLRGTFSQYYPKSLIDAIDIVLIQQAGTLLPQLSPMFQKTSESTLRAKGIRVLLWVGVKALEKGCVVIGEQDRIPSETVVWTAGVSPNIPPLREDVPRARDGKIVVEPTLAISKYQNVFVLGDAAALSMKGGGYVPALAQVAVKQAKAVARNIVRIERGELPSAFSYHHAGTFVSLGQWMAVGEAGIVSLRGRFAWWVWRTIYLSKLISWQKRAKVALDWTINLFSPRDIAEL